MRTRVHTVVLPSEVGEFADDVAQIFREFGRFPVQSLAGECSPSIDVYETDETVNIAMDLPGVDISAVRVVLKGQAILIAGEKAPRRGRGDSNFHLVERGYGRFARVVRLSIPIDTARIHATLALGELNITLPKIVERRGRAIPIAIQPVNR